MYFVAIDSFLLYIIVILYFNSYTCGSIIDLVEYSIVNFLKSFYQLFRDILAIKSIIIYLQNTELRTLEKGLVNYKTYSLGFRI